MNEKVKVDRDALYEAKAVIDASAKHAHDRTSQNLRSIKHLSGGAAQTVFNALVGNVIADLESKLPEYIEEVISSYGLALLDIDDATTKADQDLASKASR